MIMSLKETLMKDMKEAMKNKDTLRKGVITLLRNDLQAIEKNEKREITREDELRVLQRQIKQNNESIKEAQKGNRTDIIIQSEAKNRVVNEYLPKQLSEKEVKDVLTGLPVTKDMDFKTVMQLLQKAVDGGADNSIVAKTVKQYLKP
jgi:uncharacterized protein